MARVERFEELIAWQKARVLAAATYEATKLIIQAKDFGLAGQMQRAAVSIMSNIAEGFERSGLGAFHHFLVIAKASCAELRSQLYVALGVGYVDRPTFDRLTLQAEEVARIIGGLRAAVAKERHTPLRTQDSGLRTGGVR